MNEGRNFYPPYEGSNEEIIEDWKRNAWFPEDDPHDDFVGVINPKVVPGDSAIQTYGVNVVDAGGDSLAGQPVPLDIIENE